MPDEPILTGRTGALGRIRLNRPKALNSLTLEMIRGIGAALDAFEADATVAAVLISGAGERGFCAGGDIRALYENGCAGAALSDEFFREEYRLNARIARFAKPYIAIMDGFTLGGGVGISAHGDLRIVTERTILAMPETAIGFFPDIGSTWLLTRKAGESGTYLGLTGTTVGAADAIYAGLADVMVPTSNLAPMIEALGALPHTAKRDDMEHIIAPHTRAPEPGILHANAAEIDLVFASDTVEDIVLALQQSKTDFAASTLNSLAARSPTNLKLTLRLLRLARHSASLEACLERDFTAAQTMLRGGEFYEGVRAAIIDKDRQPKWSPASLAAVSDDEIERYFDTRTARLFS